MDCIKNNNKICGTVVGSFDYVRQEYFFNCYGCPNNSDVIKNYYKSFYGIDHLDVDDSRPEGRAT
jgi:hypothetical protein